MNTGFVKSLFSVSDWVVKSFPTIRLVLMILIVLLCAMLVVVVLIQPSNSSGMGAISGQSETYYSKNKSRTLEGLMKKLTVIFSIAIFVLSILFLISIAIYNPASAVSVSTEIFKNLQF